MLKYFVLLLALFGETYQAPVSGQDTTLSNVDLSLSVFDQSSAQSADTNKSYVIFAFDNDSCVGEKEARCKEFEAAINDAKTAVSGDASFAKYQSHLIFGKANKDDFPDHKKDFDKAKVTLPAVLFWPAGHSRPSCKYDSPKPESKALTQWLETKLKDDDDDDLLELDEGEEPTAAIDNSLLVCQADGGPNIVAKDDVACSDLVEAGTPQQLMQLEKTQKIWDFKQADTKFLGPADNSLPHKVSQDTAALEIASLDSASFRDATKQGKWVAMYFSAPWCHFCSCLEPVWQGVATNLVQSQRQPELMMTKVDGDSNPELRSLFNVTVYPTFLLVNKGGDKVLGRYLGPRKVFELSTWITDLIVAAENPVVKHQFELTEQGEHVDQHPVYPYTGSKAFGEQSLAALSVSVGVSGNDFDDCVESDEMKFTAPGVALLVHYPSSTSAHALEADSSLLSTHKVAQKLTVVDFMVSWCPHCQKLNPVWDTISSKYADRTDMLVVKVDLEQHPEIKKDFGIHRFPTIVYFEPGKPMTYDESHRFSGQRDTDHLEQWIEQLNHH